MMVSNIRNLLFQGCIFRCYVSFKEGTFFNIFHDAPRWDPCPQWSHGTWMLLESKGTKKATAGTAWHQMNRHIGGPQHATTPFANGPAKVKSIFQTSTQHFWKKNRIQTIPASIHNSQKRGNKSVCFRDWCVLTFSYYIIASSIQAIYTRSAPVV